MTSRKGRQAKGRGRETTSEDLLKNVVQELSQLRPQAKVRCEITGDLCGGGKKCRMTKDQLAAIADEAVISMQNGSMSEEQACKAAKAKVVRKHGDLAQRVAMCLEKCVLTRAIIVHTVYTLN